MLLSTVEKILKTYDDNKGYVRILAKEEPHIGELREFVTKLKGNDRSLTSMELLELALIVLGKNTLNQSESAKVFIALAECFGGFEALADLNQKGLLNSERAAFLEKHPKYAKQFAETIKSLSTLSKIDENTVDLLLQPFDKFENLEKLPDILKLVKGRVITPKDSPFIHALCSASKLGLYTDEVAQSLSVVREIDVISKILSVIGKFDLTCLDNDRLLAILNLQNPALFYKLLMRFDVSAKHIDILCGVEKKMHQLKCAEEYFAIEIATVFIALEKAGYFSEQTCEAMLQYPECLEMNAKIINYLKENNLHNEDNFIKVGTLRLPDGEFLAILDLLNKAGLLNQENLRALFVKSTFIKTLLSAARCLANGGVLIEASFNDIICNPLLALHVAESYEGKPYPESQPCLVDAGALDFIEIRKVAKILAQGQHSLFSSATSKEDMSFKKATGKSIQEAKCASLIKIAEFCGDGTLEQETEANVASLSYFSV